MRQESVWSLQQILSFFRSNSGYLKLKWPQLQVHMTKVWQDRTFRRGRKVVVCVFFMVGGRPDLLSSFCSYNATPTTALPQAFEMCWLCVQCSLQDLSPARQHPIFKICPFLPITSLVPSHRMALKSCSNVRW